jgi:hypothetical protein
MCSLTSRTLSTLTSLNFYNEYETLMSSAANFICWGEFDLADLPGGSFLNTSFGTKGQSAPLFFSKTKARRKRHWSCTATEAAVLR